MAGTFCLVTASAAGTLTTGCRNDPAQMGTISRLYAPSVVGIGVDPVNAALLPDTHTVPHYVQATAGGSHSGKVLLSPASVLFSEGTVG